MLLSDVNPAMLAVAQGRALDRGLVAGLRFLCADAERLPLPDRCVEKVSIAFGLRNCTDKPAVLREARRVLRPGGRFHCLEFSQVEVAALAPLYDAWSFRVLPALGARVAGDADSYRYLAESIRTFPDQEALADMMRDAGLERVSWRSLSGGIVAVAQRVAFLNSNQAAGAAARMLRGASSWRIGCSRRDYPPPAGWRRRETGARCVTTWASSDRHSIGWIALCQPGEDGRGRKARRP